MHIRILSRIITVGIVTSPDFTLTTIWGSLQFFHQQTGELKLFEEALWGSPKLVQKHQKYRA